ncbi:MAG: glycogen synthase GlgA [Acidobacteria bacterium]|nr:glycogen synthase GlgA [Acidobacteriota bacterium]
MDRWAVPHSLNDSRPRKTLAGRTPRLGVLHVASEVAPWSKTGGLADVASALPSALESLGHRVTTVLPLHRGSDFPEGERRPLTLTFGSRTWHGALQIVSLSPSRRVVGVDMPEWFDRDGLYAIGGTDYADNAERFAGLAHAALDFAQQDLDGGRIDIVHAHDWQAGLVPSLIRQQPARWTRVARAGLVLTIHNLAFQGLFPKEVIDRLGLSWDLFTMDVGEFWGHLSYLKCGVASADVVTTVSPSYAIETTQAELGFGFDGVLRGLSDRYVGILNGIDTSVWDPASDPQLPAHYSSEDLAGKRVTKRVLLETFGLPVGDDAIDRPVIGIVSRLVEQKGFDVVLAAADTLMELDATWVVVGSGDAEYERGFQALARRFPSRMAVRIGFDEGLAHLVEGGADLFLMPSRFEPCGLNQMYSLRYGTVPVVRAVGGLDDTVRQYGPRAKRANGFKFKDATPEALVGTLRQALRVYRRADRWADLVRAGMKADHSWAPSAREYVKVYRRARHEAAQRWAE